MAKKNTPQYEAKLAYYDKLVEQCPRFDRKGKTMPYTSANGYMFSLLNKAGEFGIRFSKEVQENYFKKFNTENYISYNAVMKGYILLTPEMEKDEKLLVELLNESYDYVMTLEPK